MVSLHQAGFDSAVASLGTSLTPEQARLLSRFTGEVVIAYDNDEAGKKASQRAIGILEKLDLKVRVLSLPEAKDPDEYIRAKGAEAFRRVLEGSQTHVEYRLRTILDRHDLKSDEGKVSFLKDALQLLASLPGAVEREVYALRVAEAAGVSKEAVLSETKRLRKQLLEKARTQEEREAARPAGTAQPASRGLRYSNPRAARAEEGLIRLLYLDPDRLRGRELPAPEKFTSELLGRFYRELLRRAQVGASLSLSLLAEAFTPEEMGLLTEILQKPEALGNAEKALGDYIEIIEGAAAGTSYEDLLDLAHKKYRQAKGYGG